MRVTVGANLGDPVSVIDDLQVSDVYELTPGAQMARLALTVRGDDALSVAPGTGIGTPGAALHLDSALTLMSPEGHSTEALVLVELDDDRMIAALYVLPLAPLQARVEYTLVGATRQDLRRRLAQIACVSFTRGTRITLGSGAQVPIEHLSVGDRVLTRDGGVQPVRWIGHSTVRATGALAPIVIRAGTLNNDDDLIVSPDHRLFVYQRTDRLGAGRSDLLVKARHLVNGDSVYVQTGGFVDYFQLLFDRHHIIYAEGIAAESMLIDPRTKPALPSELLARLSEVLPDHDGTPAHGLDVQKRLLDRPDAIDLLRRASAR